MGIRCKNCSTRGIPFLEVLTFDLSRNEMRCSFCGSVSVVPGPLRWGFGLFADTVILFGVVYAIVTMSVWPFLASVAVAAVTMIAIASGFAKVTRRIL